MTLHAEARVRIARRFLAALLLIFAAPVRLWAQEMTLELDPASTRVEFTLPASLHTVHGTFALKSGTIHFNPQTGAASGAVLVDVTSGNTGNDRRDRRMHKEILESQAYSEASFTPATMTGKLAPVGKSDVEVSGTLTLHGSDHQVKLPIHVELSGNQATVKTQLVIPYVAWGIKNASTFFLHVSDQVTVDITASGRLSPVPVTRSRSQMGELCNNLESWISAAGKAYPAWFTDKHACVEGPWPSGGIISPLPGSSWLSA